MRQRGDPLRRELRVLELELDATRQPHSYGAPHPRRARYNFARHEWHQLQGAPRGRLEERGLAGPFDKQELEGYHRKHLPEQVREFLRHLAPTRKPGTVKGYKATLRRFHEWLAQRRIEPEEIDRDTCLAWGQFLHEQGLHPATRVGMMVNVRKYVDWLWEREVTAAPGRDLILSSDLPKKPEYLPRPLPADNDRELQQKLKDDESKVSLGLDVMRRTGLRIGELRRLERDCVRVDHSGGHFLKVPLGKMNNERLVPLDPTTLSAVAELQSQAQDQESRWLIEGARARPVSIATFQSNLVRVAGDMSLAEPLTTHRLRHSFATSLMNGGMSLIGIMRLLGHRDQRMTMRYAQIADETVGREYFEALSRVSERYASIGAATEVVSDPLEHLQDVIRWLAKELCVGRTERHARLLIRRLKALPRNGPHSLHLTGQSPLTDGTVLRSPERAARAQAPFGVSARRVRGNNEPKPDAQ